MKIFFSASENPVHAAKIADGQARHALLSYWWVKKRSIYRPKAFDLMPKGSEFLVDSGAHTFHVSEEMVTGDKETFYSKYIEGYLEWCARWKTHIKACVELDIEEQVGLKMVERFQKKFFEPFEKEMAVVYVWHPERGYGNWGEMCRRHKYIGLPELPGASVGKYVGLLRTAEKHGAKVHGFAMTKPEMMLKVPFYTVDSTRWLSGELYGALFIWWKNRMIELTKYKKHEKRRYKTHLKRLGLDYNKLMEEEPHEVGKACVRAWVECEKWINRRTARKQYWLTDAEREALGVHAHSGNVGDSGLGAFGEEQNGGRDAEERSSTAFGDVEAIQERIELGEEQRADHEEDEAPAEETGAEMKRKRGQPNKTGKLVFKLKKKGAKKAPEDSHETALVPDAQGGGEGARNFSPGKSAPAGELQEELGDARDPLEGTGAYDPAETAQGPSGRGDGSRLLESAEREPENAGNESPGSPQDSAQTKEDERGEEQAPEDVERPQKSENNAVSPSQTLGSRGTTSENYTPEEAPENPEKGENSGRDGELEDDRDDEPKSDQKQPIDLSKRGDHSHQVARVPEGSKGAEVPVQGKGVGQTPTKRPNMFTVQEASRGGKKRSMLYMQAGLMCDTCYAQETCKAFKPAAVCSLREDFQDVAGQNVDEVIGDLQEIIAVTKERLKRGLYFESLDGGYADKTNTELMDRLADYNVKLHALLAEKSKGQNRVILEGDNILARIFGVPKEVMEATDVTPTPTLKGQGGDAGSAATSMDGSVPPDAKERDAANVERRSVLDNAKGSKFQEMPGSMPKPRHPLHKRGGK